MNGLMMDFQLTLPALLRRVETYFGDREVVTRLPDRSFHHYTYRDMGRRAKQLAVALQELGLQRGDRVATLCWNHYQHLEAYFGIPCAGLVLHTVNIRLHPNEVAYIANHSADRVLIVDRSQLPLYEAVRDATSFDHVFVVEDSTKNCLSRPVPRIGKTRAWTSTRRRPCATRAGRPDDQKESCTRTDPPCCTPWGSLRWRRSVWP